MAPVLSAEEALSSLAHLVVALHHQDWNHKGVDNFCKVGGLASSIEFVAHNKSRIHTIIWTLLSFDLCMCS